MTDAIDPLLREGLESFLERQCRQPVETPEGLIVRCRSRLKARCPSCSALHVGDWQAIIRSGVFEAPAGSRFFLLTLTAPSFGPVHRVVKAGRRAQPCRCGTWHDPNADGHLRGLPIDQDDYDYLGQVDWNASTGRLWDATRSRLRALLPSMEFASVREWQARGALHLHVLVRVSFADAVGLGVERSGKQWRIPAIEQTVRSVRSHTDLGLVAEWGANVDCRPIRADESTGRAVWYLTKAIGYLVKDVADGGGTSSATGRRHWALMSEAASRYRCGRCQRLGARCGGLLHRQWGARSHVVSVSRRARKSGRPGWSLTGLTRKKQQEGRLAWAMAHYASTEQSRIADSRRRHHHVERVRRLLGADRRATADPP